MWAVCVGPVTERVIYGGLWLPSVLGFRMVPVVQTHASAAGVMGSSPLVGELKSRMSWGAAENKALFPLSLIVLVGALFRKHKQHVVVCYLIYSLSHV